MYTTTQWLNYSTKGSGTFLVLCYPESHEIRLIIRFTLYYLSKLGLFVGCRCKQQNGVRGGRLFHCFLFQCIHLSRPTSLIFAMCQWCECLYWQSYVVVVPMTSRRLPQCRHDLRYWSTETSNDLTMKQTLWRSGVEYKFAKKDSIEIRAESRICVNLDPIVTAHLKCR